VKPFAQNTLINPDIGRLNIYGQVDLHNSFFDQSASKVW